MVSFLSAINLRYEYCEIKSLNHEGHEGTQRKPTRDLRGSYFFSNFTFLNGKYAMKSAWCTM
jgi:hypothetical protein